MNLNTPEHWNAAWAKHYTDYPQNAYRREMATRILRYIPLGATILDVGGGCGPFSEIATGRDVTVLDFSAWSVEHLRGQGIKALVWDARNPETLDVGWVDAIVCTEFLEHLDDPALVVRFTANHTNLAFFSVPNNTMGPKSCSEHVRVYNEQSLRDELAPYWPDITIITGFSLLAIARKGGA